MKNWKRFVVGLTGALLVLTTGCGQEQTDPAPDEVPDVTVPPVIDVDVSQLLTTEEVASALGVESVSVQMYEEGLWAHYATEDGLTTADIHIDKCERSMFDLILSQYANLQEAPNLGDVAQWSPETKGITGLWPGIQHSGCQRYSLGTGGYAAGCFPSNCGLSVGEVARLIVFEKGNEAESTVKTLSASFLWFNWSRI